VLCRQREQRNVRRRWELTEMPTTPERDPDEDAVFPHIDEELAEYVDENGPAFRTPYFDDTTELFEERKYEPHEEPPDV